ncbi:MAG: ATP-binding protein [Dethiobacteria bacterium]|jgi:two-component system OmpR family sensor kinase
MLNSIRLRMTITYLLLIVAIMLATGIVLLNMLEKHYLSSEEENIERTGRLAAQSIISYLRDDADPVLLSSVAENISHQINARVIIVSTDNLVLGDSVRIGGLSGSKIERPEIQDALKLEKGCSVQYSHISKQWVLQVAVPAREEDGTPLGVIFLASSLNPVYATLAAVQRFLLMFTFLALLFAGVLVVLFSHHLTGPIKRLTSAAQQMAEGKLDQQIPVTSRDEIGRLAQQFNVMASRIMETNQRLTRFVADVSHELRTPLASIHLCLQSMQEYEMKPEEQKEFLDDIYHETQRLIYLVEDLLEMTRRQEVAEKMEVFSLKALLEGVLASIQPRVDRKELKLFTEIDEKLPLLNVSPEALKRVLFNLLDNAIKYTPSGGWLKLIAESDENNVRVTVQDTGCGIPEEAIPYIFERFYRVDKARSRYLGGTGLGLAICKEIIEHYGGEIGLEESQEDKGSTFYFILPVERSIQEYREELQVVESPEPV